MVIAVQMRGINKVIRNLTLTDRNLSKELNKEGELFLNDVADKAKILAPKDTGRMANSITVEPYGNGWIMQVNNRGALFQERGFKPHFFITDPGRPEFLTNKLPLGQWVFVKKNTPFVGPALEYNLSKFSQRMHNAVRRSIR